MTGGYWNFLAAGIPERYFVDRFYVIYISRCNLTQEHRITINNSRCHHASFTEGKQFWTNLSSVNEEIYDSITASDDTFHQNMSRTIFSLAQSNTSNATIQHQIWNINIARF